MFIALVADDMRVIDSIEIFCADHANMQDTHGSLDEISMRLFSFGELFTGLLEAAIVGQDALLDFLFTLDKLILSHNVLLGELIKVDAPICIVVKFFKKLFNDLRTMLIVDALSCKEIIHFLTIDFAVTVGINCCKFLPQTFLFRHLVR